MKKIIVLILLLKSIVVTSAQNVPVEDTTEHFVITEAGKPIGKIMEKMMNKDGGTLVSQDGAVELIIPPGALSKKTTISIQTMTNTFQNGNGPSYRLEPSGIQFQQPVKIIFHYNPEESEDSAQLLMGISMQDDKGQWYSLNEFTLDTVAKTISGNIDHFSIWATFDQLKLVNVFHAERLKVNYAALLGIWGVFADKTEMKIRGLSKLKTMKKPPEWVSWYVDGIKFGNAKVGTLKSGNKMESAIDVRSNYYTAPNNIPDVNPVTISVELVWSITTSDGVFLKSAFLETKILIYDNGYEVKMVIASQMDLGDRGYVNYKDTGSFVVSITGKEARVIEKINKNTDTEWNTRNGKCIITKEKDGTGFIHVNEVKSIKVIPAESPAANPWVEIEFVNHPSVNPIIKFDCPVYMSSSRSIMTTDDPRFAVAMSMVRSHTFPKNVKFEAKEGMQILLEEGGFYHYKITVEKLRDD